MGIERPMNRGKSLLERAAEVYDLKSVLNVAPIRSVHPVSYEAQPPAQQAEPQLFVTEEVPVFSDPADPWLVRHVARGRLQEAGLIVPEAQPTGLAEEFRIIKRQLLAQLQGGNIAEEKRRMVLVCSGQPDEGKTFSALNLALSLSTEKDLEVLLVDCDFPKPEILSLLGLENGPGLTDAIADPAIAVENLVIRTDVGGLSILPAGRRVNNVTELLSSEETRQVMADLAANPRRIVLFDSPPALMASPALVLAGYAGAALVVVRADRTTEADLRETVGLLSGCGNVMLMLNGAGFAATGRRFGSYYGLDG